MIVKICCLLLPLIKSEIIKSKITVRMFSKKVLSIAIACLLSAGMKLSAQIQVGWGLGSGGMAGGAQKIDDETMALFKKSTLIVTIPNKDSALLEKYEHEF